MGYHACILTQGDMPVNRTCLIFFFLLAACSDYDLSRPDKAEPEGEEDPIPDPDPVGAPDIELSPTTVDFGFLPRNCLSAWQPITIANVGDEDLEVASYDLTGQGASGYEIHPEDELDPGDLLVLAPGEDVTVRVRFSPTAWVRYEPDFSVESNDPDEPTAGVDLAGEGAQDAMTEETFTQDLHDEVDVLWVVDNSGSMSDDLITVGNNFEAFIQVFLDLGLDFHMGVITTDMDNPAQSGRLVGPYITNSTADPVGDFIDLIDLGSSGSADEVGFEAIQAALTNPILSDENAGFLRTDAALTSIVITDEDNSSFQSAASFVTFYEALKPTPELTTFSAICEDLFISCSKYAAAADATGGITGDIAASDYSTLLEQISLTAAGMTISFDLGDTPSDLSRVVVTVEGRTVPYDSSNGWTYDSADGAIVFHGSAVPAPGESGTVTYPVAGECP